MEQQSIQITLSKDKLEEILRAYHLIGDFLESILTKEQIYKARFTKGLDLALEEVQSGITQKVDNLDDFIG